MTEALQRDAATGRETAVPDRMDTLPLRPRHHLPSDVPPLWATLRSRWTAVAVRTPRASARD